MGQNKKEPDKLRSLDRVSRGLDLWGNLSATTREHKTRFPSDSNRTDLQIQQGIDRTLPG